MKGDKINFADLAFAAAAGYLFQSRKNSPSGNNPKPNGNLSHNDIEGELIDFLAESILPRKSYLFVHPGLIYKSDPPERDPQPILYTEGIDAIANAFLVGREHKEGNPDWVNDLDNFWSREHSATILAFELLKQHHGTEYKPRYEHYLPGRFLMYRRLVDSIKELMVDLEDKRVIEIGGGSGISLTMLAEEGAKAHNLDRSESALNYFKFLADHYGVKGYVDTTREDFYQTGLSDNIFDLTYNVGVFEHLASNKREKLLEEMVRITKPEGLVMVSVPNPNSPFYKMMIDKQREVLGKDKWFPMTEYEDVNPIELLENGGLKPINEEGYAPGFTQISPPTRIKPGIIKREDFRLFSLLPDVAGTQDLLKAWYLLENNASRQQLERYAMFTHAFGRKAA